MSEAMSERMSERAANIAELTAMKDDDKPFERYLSENDRGTIDRMADEMSDGWRKGF